MKRPTLRDRSEDTESHADEQMADVLANALSSNDKVIEIRPAKKSSGLGLKKLLLIVAGAVGFAYWVQRSQKPNELIKSAKEKTATRTGQAAETIEDGSETASEQIEAGSEQAGEALEEAGETAAEQTEKAGEMTAEENDDISGFSET